MTPYHSKNASEKEKTLILYIFLFYFKIKSFALKYGFYDFDSA